MSAAPVPNRGFRVEIEGGEQARIGIRCGEKHFGGGAWQAAVADYDRRVAHAQYLARVKPALDAIEQIMPLVREWHQRTNLPAKWMPTFRGHLGELFNRLAEEAKRSEGGWSVSAAASASASIAKVGKRPTSTRKSPLLLASPTPACSWRRARPTH